MFNIFVVSRTGMSHDKAVLLIKGSATAGYVII